MDQRDLSAERAFAMHLADVAAEAAIRDALRAACPNDGFHGEESGRIRATRPYERGAVDVGSPTRRIGSRSVTTRSPPPRRRTRDEDRADGGQTKSGNAET